MDYSGQLINVTPPIWTKPFLLNLLFALLASPSVSLYKLKRLSVFIALILFPSPNPLYSMFCVPIALVCIKLSVTPTLLEWFIFNLYHSCLHSSPCQSWPLLSSLTHTAHLTLANTKFISFLPYFVGWPDFFPFLKTLCTWEGAVLRSPLWQREDRVLVWQRYHVNKFSFPQAAC